jgi:carboxypeptidase T
LKSKSYFKSVANSYSLISNSFFWVFVQSTIAAVAVAVSLSSVARADVVIGRDYENASRFLAGLQSAYPKTVQGFTLGVSDAGLPIYGVKIGSGPVRHLVVATHHGNEFPSAEVALNFAESIAKKPIPGMTVFVIPVLNINGYERRNRYEQVNGQGLDLNRDYPGPCGTEGPFYSKSTMALADFVEKQNIVAAATLHTYKPAVVYPWGISTDDVETPYTPLFHKLASAATIESHYEIGYSTIVMYPADGTFEDYIYWKHGIYSLLFEIGSSNHPSQAELTETVRVNVEGLREMLRTSPKTRAPDHQFTGRCSPAGRFLDLHLE